MAGAESSLLIRISGNIEDFNSKFDAAKKKTEDLGDAFESIGKKSAIAFAAITAEIGFSIKAFGESEAATRSLSLALENQGLNVEVLSAKYKEQAEALSTLTGIDDDRITKGQAVLQGLVGQVEITDRMTKAAVDLSTQTGSLESAFEILGRGIQGNVRQLRQFGITIDENLPKSERMREITEKIEQKFGDQAAAANKGVGSIKGLGVAFDDLQKAIGSQFAPLFELVVQKLTNFINLLRNNQTLVTWTAGLLATGVAFTGLVTAVSVAVPAIAAFSAAVTAMGLTLGVASGGLTILSGLLVTAGIALAQYVGKNLEAKDAVGLLEEKIGGLQKKLEATNAELAVATPGTGLFRRLTEESKQTQTQIEQLNKQLERAQQLQLSKAGASGNDKDKIDAAKKAADEEARIDALKIERMRLNLSIERDITEQNSTELIAIKKKEVELLSKLETEKNAKVRAELTKQLEVQKDLEKEAQANDIKQREVFDKTILKNNENFQKLSEEQKKRFLAKNKQELTSQIHTQKQAEEQVAKDRALVQIKSNNQFLEDQVKFGTAYALINQAMHSAIIEGTKSAFGELAQLQSSSSATLKSIGKVAATANIIIKTAESAMNIYAGFSTIPIVGPILGVAGAAAAIAFGAEQVSQVQAADDGGRFTGGTKGVDSILAMVHPGEFAVPDRNYEETVNAVAFQRNAQAGKETAVPQGEGGNMKHTIELHLKGDAGKLFEQKVVQRRRLGRALI